MGSRGEHKLPALAVERSQLVHEQAMITKRKVLDRAAEESIVFAFHFPSPGLGHIIEKGKGWEWQPI